MGKVKTEANRTDIVLVCCADCRLQTISTVVREKEQINGIAAEMGFAHFKDNVDNVVYDRISAVGPTKTLSCMHESAHRQDGESLLHAIEKMIDLEDAELIVIAGHTDCKGVGDKGDQYVAFQALNASIGTINAHFARLAQHGAIKEAPQIASMMYSCDGDSVTKVQGFLPGQIEERLAFLEKNR
jgi:hypothetical protein